MWVFTRYGFVSVACARKEDGSIDVDSVMLRARSRKHLENLKERFAETILGKAEILELPATDYRFRIILPKTAWAAIVSELAMEQTWSNFKDEAVRFARIKKDSGAYVSALHKIWGIMFAIQTASK